MQRQFAKSGLDRALHPIFPKVRVISVVNIPWKHRKGQQGRCLPLLRASFEEQGLPLSAETLQEQQCIARPGKTGDHGEGELQQGEKISRDQEQEGQRQKGKQEHLMVVWFKKDLRLDDHPGVHQACAAARLVVPLFVFDPQVYSSVIDCEEMAYAFADAVVSLKESLRERGTDLTIVCGSWDEVIPTCMEVIKGRMNLISGIDQMSVMTERECDGLWAKGVERLRGAMDGHVKMDTWECLIHEDYSEDVFPDWVSSTLTMRYNKPLDTNHVSFPDGEREDWRRSLDQALRASLVPGDMHAPFDGEYVWREVERISSSRIFDTELSHDAHLHEEINHRESPDDNLGAIALGSEQQHQEQEIVETSSWTATTAPRTTKDTQGREKEFFFDSKKYPFLVCSSGALSLRSISEYIAYDETTRKTYQDIGNAIAAFDTDASINGCFPAIFTRAIYGTGTLSRRRVYHEAVQFLEAQGEVSPFNQEPLFRGPFSWLRWILTSSGGDVARAQRVRKAKAARDSVELSDFHLGLAYGRQGRSAFGAAVEHWRWRGVLTDYLYAASSSSSHEGVQESPSIVLVHGFGAFGEHWRRNVRELADKGFDVYAPTFPGYGRSEKMSLQYGQDLWRDFLADFIKEVVQKPVVLSGNSIGGYISASVAADFPGMVKGLVLLNSAGQINESFCPKQFEREQLEKPKKYPPSIIVNGISTLLFRFLEADIENQLQRLYPTRPENADAWLGREIRRASRDSQAIGVFRSVFYLPSPRPLNYLIQSLYGGPVLVLQGALDPLNDAPSRARQITDSCPTAQCILLQAGHCPHDEVPEIVNAEIESFARRSFSK